MQNSKPYNLEERTFQFAQRCREFVKQLPRTVPHQEYGRQLIRSSGSQAANYLEANECLGKKDFAHRIRIARKEAKESCLWLKLCECDERLKVEQQALLQEGIELRNIFTAILGKTGL